MRCVYDGCHDIEGAHNVRYCKDCRCKRKQENSVKRLSRGVNIYDEEQWRLEEARKEARAQRNQAKNEWILANKTFAMFDIESSNLDADFGEMLCACVRPMGGPTATFVLPTFEEGDKWRLVNDAEIVAPIRDELRKYDYIVTWYGSRFDLPYLTTRLKAAKEERLGYARHVDLYYTSRWKLKLHSNRLASVGDFLFGKTKKDSIVGGIWLAALRGDKKAMNYIVKHCQKDVIELERVFKDLVPHRNLSLTGVMNY